MHPFLQIVGFNSHSIYGDEVVINYHGTLDVDELVAFAQSLLKYVESTPC